MSRQCDLVDNFIERMLSSCHACDEESEVEAVDSKIDERAEHDAETESHDAWQLLGGITSGGWSSSGSGGGSTIRAS
jgi:hypothetical protein